MRKFSLRTLFPFCIPFMILSIPLAYFLPSFIARLFLVSAFLVPLLLIGLYSIVKPAQNLKVTYLLLFVAVSSFIFLLRNMIILQPYYDELALSETMVIAQNYGEQGTLIFDTAHSYFFQAPLLMHFMSVICGISIIHVNFLIIVVHILLSSLVGLYILRATQTENNGKMSFFILLALALLVVSSTTISLGVGYRQIAYLTFLLLMIRLFIKGIEHRSDFVTILLLVSGITLGSPVAILLMIPFFFLFSVFKKRSTAIIFALIPLSYFINAGYAYMYFLRSYSTFALEGFQSFLKEIIFSYSVEKRVLPWERLSIPTMEDTYVNSAAFLSLLALSLLVVLILTYIWTKERQSIERDDNGSFLRADCVGLWFVLTIVVIAYVGASVKREVSFSDIRTILIGYVVGLLPFTFISKMVFKKIMAKKVLLIIVIVLMIISSIRTFYFAYPKSIDDPINVVEDARLELTSVYYAGRFLSNTHTAGSIAMDYKTYRVIGAYLFSGADVYHFPETYNISILDESVVNDPASKTIVFDINGLRFGSLYIPPEVYIEAYTFSRMQNLVYNSGNITIAQRK